MSLTLDVILPFFIMTSYSFFADIESPCSYIVVRAYTAFFLKYTICLALKSMDGEPLHFETRKSGNITELPVPSYILIGLLGGPFVRAT